MSSKTILTSAPVNGMTNTDLFVKVESQQIGFLASSPKILANNGKKVAGDKSLTNDFENWQLYKLFRLNENLKETSLNLERWYLEEFFLETEDDFGIDQLFNEAVSSVDYDEESMDCLGSLFDDI